MHHPRIPNRAAQTDKPQGLEERTTPGPRPTGPQTGTRALEQQAAQTPPHVVVELSEVVRRIPRSEILPPPPKNPVHVRDDQTQVRVTAASRGQRPHAGSHLLHRTPRRPSVQVVHASPRPCPDGTAHALVQMTPQEVKALTAIRQVDRQATVKTRPSSDRENCGSSPSEGQHRWRTARTSVSRGLGGRTARRSQHEVDDDCISGTLGHGQRRIADAFGRLTYQDTGTETLRRYPTLDVSTAAAYGVPAANARIR